MAQLIYISIAFDPREEWFVAGFSFKEMQVAQWSYDRSSAARALARFLADDNEYTGTQLPALKAISESTKVIVHLDDLALGSLQETAIEEKCSLEEWLGSTFQATELEIHIFQK